MTRIDQTRQAAVQRSAERQARIMDLLQAETVRDALHTVAEAWCHLYYCALLAGNEGGHADREAVHPNVDGGQRPERILRAPAVLSGRATPTVAVAASDDVRASHWLACPQRGPTDHLDRWTKSPRWCDSMWAPRRTATGGRSCTARYRNIAAILKGQTRIREAFKAKGTITPFVFPDDAGGRLPDNYAELWREACRLTGCPGKIPHDFRRTAVRDLVRAGAPEKTSMQLTAQVALGVDRYDIVNEGKFERLAALPIAPKKRSNRR